MEYPWTRLIMNLNGIVAFQTVRLASRIAHGIDGSKQLWKRPALAFRREI